MTATTATFGSLPTTGLPRADYSPEQFERERDAFWRRTWRLACHVAQLPEAGDWRRYELLDDDLIVVRQEDGSIRAFHNVCRHRGASLVEQPAGRCERAFTCPYHGWSYGRDGANRGTPRMDDVDRAQFGLFEAHVELWQGFVFVATGAAPPPPIAEQLAGLDEPLARYDLLATRILDDREHVVEANWKIVWENGLECYHCAINHPELKQVVDTTAREHREPDELLLPHDFTDDFPLLPGLQSVTIDGRVEQRRLLGDPDDPPTRVAFLSWHSAQFELVASPDHVAMMSFRPLGPARTAIRTMWFVHADAREGVDFDPEHLFGLHRVTREQDDALLARVQRGVSSPAFRPGPTHPSYEADLRNFARIYHELMDSAPDQEDTA
jgi:phenylpropionate dioxygenase-like ring-hydroxylating dioxygenase large terminal subunit